MAKKFVGFFTKLRESCGRFTRKSPAKSRQIRRAKTSQKSSTKKTIAKILFLYLGTSAAFLCVGFYHAIKKESENIIFSQVAALRDVSLEIHDFLWRNERAGGKKDAQFLRESLSRLEISVPFAVYDKNDNLIFSSLSKPLSAQELRDGFARFENKVIVSPDIAPKRAYRKVKMPKMPRLGYKIFLEDVNQDAQIFGVQVKFALIFVAILACMGAVAAVMIRIFLRPINDHAIALDNFIKDATHEINTPLSVILMSIETLREQSSEDAKKLARIRLAALQLNQIYADLVAYNFPHSVDSREVGLDLAVILRERLDFFAPFFAQKGLVLECDIAQSAFFGAQNKWRLIFDNLLSNAIKYNKKGGFVRVSLARGRFSVANSGECVREADLERIFERYERASSDFSGFGIGLFIVKKICDESGISLRAEATGDGMKFSLAWEDSR